jgi:hypothetical protein
VIYGDETVCFFELYVPRCALSYATSPCAAVLGTTGTHKCFNTRKSCQDIAHFTPTETVTLRFSRQQQSIEQYNVIPSLQDLSITPLVLNLAGMNEHSSAFGQRETVTVLLDDHLHSDIGGLDKYRLERYSGAAITGGVGYDPYTRGTFWGKFLARNPYYVNMQCAVRIGKIGQALSDMRVQHYIVTRIDGPNDGQVRITLKDVFSLVEDKKAVCPLPSKGRLNAGITTGSGSATLAPAGIGATYGTAGYVRIGQEVMQFTRAGDVITFIARNALNTTLAAHSAEDLVQEVAAFVTQRIHDIAYTLMTQFTDVPAASISYASWSTAAAALINLYTGYITEPTPVADLLGELEQQVGFTLWPDVVDGTVHFKALLASTPSETVTDNAWIVDKSLQLRRDDTKRVSLVDVYYGMVDPTKKIDETTNYRSHIVSVDASGNYNTDQVQQIFSRWIPQFGRTVAQECGDRILAMFTDPPIEAKFKYHASRSGELALADLFNLSTAETQDETGAIDTVTMTPISISYGEDEDTCTAQEVKFAAPPDPAAERFIYIDSDAYNVNLRTAFDSIYPAPTGVEHITFQVSSGVRVKSSTISLPALRKGSWPVGCVIKLIVQSGARIQGKGGDGGHGGGDGAPFGTSGGTAGQNGGDAINADGSALTIDNQGQVWAGGGGGGGGSSAGINDWYGGGGGGAGCGSDPASGGSPSYNWDVDGGSPEPQYGGSSTTESAGGGGDGGRDRTSRMWGGRGGDGGGPGIAGTAGGHADTSGDGPIELNSPGAGGAAGNYINGNAFVTWLTTGDVRGGAV